MDDIPQYQRKKMRKIGAGRKPYYPDIDKAMLDLFRYERGKMPYCYLPCELEEFLNGANSSGPKINIPLPDGFKDKAS